MFPLVIDRANTVSTRGCQKSPKSVIHKKGCHRQVENAKPEYMTKKMSSTRWRRECQMHICDRRGVNEKGVQNWHQQEGCEQQGLVFDAKHNYLLKSVTSGGQVAASTTKGGYIADVPRRKKGTLVHRPVIFQKVTVRPHSGRCARRSVDREALKFQNT